MTDDAGLTRRQALALLAGGGVAALGVGALVRSRDDDPTGDDPAAPPVDAADALALGAAVLAAHPTLLADPVAIDGIDPAEVQADPVAALVARDRIEADYADGTVLDVQGWVLSRTECAVAALAART